MQMVSHSNTSDIICDIIDNPREHNQLYHWRLEHGFNREQVGAFFGVNGRTISNWERRLEIPKYIKMILDNYERIPEKVPLFH